MIKNSGAIISLNNWLKKLNYQIIVDKEIKIYYQNKEIFSKENKDAMNRITITIPSRDCQLTLNLDNLTTRNLGVFYQKASFTLINSNQKVTIEVSSPYSTKIQDMITEYHKENPKSGKKTSLKLDTQSLNLILEEPNQNVKTIEYNMAKNIDVIIKNYEKIDNRTSYIELRYLMQSLNLISRHFINYQYDYEKPNINYAFREEDAHLIAKKIFYSSHLQKTINRVKQEINQLFPCIIPYLTSIYPYLNNVSNYDCQYGYYNFDQIVKDHSLTKKLTK